MNSKRKQKDLHLKLLEIDKELEYRRKINPLQFFKPLELQATFEQSKAKVKGTLGGNRSGKTEIGAEYIISKCLAKPKQRWWACAESFAVSRDIQQRKVWKLVPKNRIKYGHWNEITGFPNRKLLLDNGSVINFKSFDQGVESFASDDLDGCLAKGTLVALADGSYKLIEDVVSGDKVFSINSLKLRKVRANKVLWQKKTGIKKTLILKIRGIKIQLTSDHRILVSGKGWIEAKDIQVGDFVYFPPLKGLDGAKVDISEHQAYWLGLMIGDGYIHPKRLQFTCLNTALWNEAFIYLQKFENVSFKKKGDRQHILSAENKSKPNDLRELLKRYNLVGTHAYDKFIPQDIFRASDKIKKMFLRALYNCDGWVARSKVGYASTSKRLAYDVALLLNSLGVKTNIQELPARGNWRPQWHVFIGKSDNVLWFLDNIGITRDIKAIEKVKEEAKRRLGILSDNARSCKSRKNFAKLASVKAIEEGEEVEVYDIKVERDENFFANGICVHNCWNDEEPAYNIVKEQKMRLLDRDGEMIFTMTSTKGVTDFIQEVFEDHEVMKSEYAPLVRQQLPRVVHKDGREFFLLWTTENPYIDQARTLHEAQFMTRDEKKSRIYGLPINLAGKIYMIFNRDIHVLPFEMIPRTNVTLYHILDPHDRKPWSMIWVAMHATGTAYCVDEYPNSNFNDMLYDDKTIGEYKTIINQKEEALRKIFPRPVYKRIIDPNFGNATRKLAERQGGQSHSTVKKQLLNKGLRFHDGIDRPMEDGHLIVREKLNYYEKNDEIVMQPKFFIADNCANTIRHLSRYSRKDILTADGDVKDIAKPKEKYKDYSDLARYFWMSNPRHIEHTAQEPRKPGRMY